MRMARKLKLITCRGCGEGRSRLVGKQELERRFGRSARDRGGRIALLCRIEIMGAVIGDARHDDVASLVVQHDVLVHEHAQAEPAKLAHPRAYS